MQHAGARKLREDHHEPSARPRTLHLVELDAPPTYAENGRRTVKITGQTVPPRRRRSVTATQIQARPDRIALWAVLLGLFLVFMAVATANAAPL
jgi:hypothetical protein